MKIIKLTILFLFMLVVTPISVLATNFELEQNGTKTKYEKLSEAISEVQDTEVATITLLRDADLNAITTINTNKNIIIDGNNYTITYLNNNGTWYTGQLFNVKSGGNLTIKNVIIDGNNNYEFDNETFQNHLVTNTKASSTSVYLKSEENKPNITANMFNNAGTLTLENVTVKNFYSISSKSIISASANTTTTIKDSNFIHCASTGGGIVINITGANGKAYIEGNTNIEDVYVASNGGIFKIYNGSMVEMNNGIITGVKSSNANGYISMTYGTNSIFKLNGGTIHNNYGAMGKSNGRNAPFYVHSGSKFIMNGGIIENNTGSSAGGLDAPGYANSDVELNGGIIQYNKVTIPEYEQRKDVNIQNDYELVIKEEITINGNVDIAGPIVNNGTINGNVTLDLTSSTKTDTISGEGKITGDVRIKYTGENKPIINESINIIGRQVLYDPSTQSVIRFEYNDGIDQAGYGYDLIAINNEDGTLEKNPEPTKEGHSLLDWYINPELTIIWDHQTIPTDLILYANWKVNEYVITWIIDGKEIKETYKYGEIINSSNAPVKEGYEFIGWENFEENMTTPAGNITFVATFEKLTNPNTTDKIFIYNILLVLIVLVSSLLKIYTKQNIKLKKILDNI